jgi:hypothetical protein
MEITLSKKTARWFDQPVTYVDEVKLTHTCNVSTCERFIHSRRPFCCFWCHIRYNDRQPFHCPLRHHSAQIVKVIEESYTLKGNVMSDDEPLENDFPNVSHKRDSSYYEVDGSFCSWNCVAAFIEAHAHDPFYDQSMSLLYLMKGENTRIVPSPSYLLLQDYGGHLSTEDFQTLIGNQSYQRQHNLVFVNHIFEKKLI